MRKYLAIFNMYFARTMQYRTAAWAGVVTQFFWGVMAILMYKAFYQSNAGNFPMTFSALASYIWLQQAFLSLYMLWFFENDIFEMIRSGQLAYEMVRPISLYTTWFMRTASIRVARALLRCVPILLVAAILPQPYRLSLPSDAVQLLLFMITMILALGIVVAMSMIIYFISFYLLNSEGIRLVFMSAGEFLSGAVLPLPFLPFGVQRVLNLLPFAAVQNVPFRIYSGDLSGLEMQTAVLLQLVWLVVLIGIGKALEKNVVKRAVIQGG